MIPAWPSFLPNWLIDDHNISTSQSVKRSALPGHVDQAKNSHRVNRIASAKLYLSGIQSPMFEYFVRELCNEGVGWFTGPFVTSAGLVSAKVRIVEGVFTKTITARGAFISCSVEFES
jgi:hypothetical protein